MRYIRHSQLIERKCEFRVWVFLRWEDRESFDDTKAECICEKEKKIPSGIINEENKKEIYAVLEDEHEVQ